MQLATTIYSELKFECYSTGLVSRFLFYRGLYLIAETKDLHGEACFRGLYFWMGPVDAKTANNYIASDCVCPSGCLLSC